MRSLTRLAAVCLCLTTYAWPVVSRAAEPAIWLALSEPGGAYAETADAVLAELERATVRPEVIVKPWRALLSLPTPPRLVVTVGVGAMRGMAEAKPRAPLLATLVPRAAYMATAAQLTQAVPTHGALWLDQPAARQLAVLQLALPSHPRVGIMFGPESRALEAEFLRADSGSKGITVVGTYVTGAENLPAALQKLADDADVLLALADPAVFNGSTIQNILTAAYRRRLPLVGFSPAYVKAGALLALYSTPRQIGTQVGEIVRATLGGRPLPPPQGPRQFAIEVNPGVARSLGLAVDAESAQRWIEQLTTRERTP